MIVEDLDNNQEEFQSETSLELSDPVHITNVSIVADHTYGSFSLYEILLSGEKQQWTILRRYSWFLAIYDQLIKDEIEITCEFPPTTWFGKLDPTVVETRKPALEAFLRYLINDQKLLSISYVTSFLLPVRCFTTFIELSINARAIKESRLSFIDPLGEKDTVHPQIVGAERDYEHQSAWNDLALNQLESFPSLDEELLQIRKELFVLKKRKNLSPLQESFVRAYSSQLRQLTKKKKLQQPSELKL